MREPPQNGSVLPSSLKLHIVGILRLRLDPEMSIVDVDFCELLIL